MIEMENRRYLVSMVADRLFHYELIQAGERKLQYGTCSGKVVDLRIKYCFNIIENASSMSHTNALFH